MHLRVVRSAMVVSAALVMAACSTFNDSDETHLWAFGTVEQVEDLLTGECRILRDDGMRLHVLENYWPDYTPRAGQRVYFNYTVAGRSDIAPEQKLDVKLYHIAEVEMRRPVLLSEMERNPSAAAGIGSDPVTDVVSIEFSGRYANVVYEYPREMSRDENLPDGHVIDMVIDDVEAAEAGKVTVRLCHNAGGDTPAAKPDAVFAIRRAEVVSFDMQRVAPYALNGMVEVEFEWEAYYGDSFAKSGTDGVVVRFTVPQEILP